MAGIGAKRDTSSGPLVEERPVDTAASVPAPPNADRVVAAAPAPTGTIPRRDPPRPHRSDGNHVEPVGTKRRVGAPASTARSEDRALGSGGEGSADGADGAVAADGPADESAELARALLELEDGETTLFEAAISAFHAGEYQRAESLFLEEAERTIDDAPQRAAIAFRQAALAARQGGNVDGSDHWMRLAGREYLRVSEDDRTPLPFIREAAVMAAKCFLSVENLHVASKGLRRAQAIETALSADADLMADVPGIPFRHGHAPATGDTPERAGERAAPSDGTRREAEPADGADGASRTTGDAPEVGPATAGEGPGDGPAGPAGGRLRPVGVRLGGRLRRRRQLLPGQSVP
jgi:hypothetical protein